MFNHISNENHITSIKNRMRKETPKSVVIPSTNTHYYDRIMSKEILEKIKPYAALSRDITKEDKLVCLRKLRAVLEKLNPKPIAMKFYDGIISSYIQEDGKNYDPINKLDPIDLLYTIYLIYQQNKDILLLVPDQLEDMKTGFCPQGRTIRLVQIIKIFL